MRTGAGATLCLAAAMRLFAQADATAPDREYSLLRENEDWSFLSNSSNRDDFWDPIKYIPLGSNGSYVSLGGEVREVFEQVGNDNWGKQNYTNAFFLQRYMLHSDWHLGSWRENRSRLRGGYRFAQ